MCLLSEDPKKLLGDEQMEEMLRALATGLKIQQSSEDGQSFRLASTEQVDAFIEAMKKHLVSREKLYEYGDIITYDYHRGKIRGGSRRHDERDVESPNANLGEVFSKMPKLPEGECYAFPIPTIISFQIVGKSGEDGDFNPVKASNWILEQI